MQEKQRLLISFAHPDDESFGLGGLIGRYVAEGTDVYYLCATNGDVGTVNPEMLEGYNSIAERRLAELECASKVLGFKEVIKLGYKDSGMMNTEDNLHPDSLWYKWGRQPEDVTQKVVKAIREIKPHVIITFNRYGGYGHPDHIAIQQATTEAFHLAGSPDYKTDSLAPYQPQKLYYASIPTFMVQIGILITRLQGKNPRRLGRNNDIDMVAILDHVEPIHTYIDITDYLDLWQEASACHVSQGGGRGGIIPSWLRRTFGVKQGFTRIYPIPMHNNVHEYDLFDGVKLEQPAASSTL